MTSLSFLLFTPLCFLFRSTKKSNLMNANQLQIKWERFNDGRRSCVCLSGLALCVCLCLMCVCALGALVCPCGLGYPLPAIWRRDCGAR
jgi:hypothetical protein